MLRVGFFLSYKVDKFFGIAFLLHY